MPSRSPPLEMTLSEIAEMQEKHRRKGLDEAATLLLSTAEDFQQIVTRLEDHSSNNELFSAREAIKNVIVLKDKIALLRGQAQRIKEL